MSIAKELAENPIDITIETTILAPIDIVWKYFNLPEHVTKWNAANDDWHTTHDFNDLKPGGKFSYRMEAKDNSFGFDFSGTYNSIQKNEAISYTLDDGRNVNLAFSNEENSTKIIEIFEAENEYSFEIQQTGWQMILNNFKKYTESN
ncbi:MAG: SRPBCC family protein [Opitutaceae bacterium]|nr:SRPBCC family protein [Cytophagales bacterium]